MTKPAIQTISQQEIVDNFLAAQFAKRIEEEIIDSYVEIAERSYWEGYGMYVCLSTFGEEKLAELLKEFLVTAREVKP